MMKTIITTIIFLVVVLLGLLAIGKILERFSDEGWAPIIKTVVLFILFIVYVYVLGKIDGVPY